MDRLKVVHIVPSLASGGAERITVDICNELSKNHQVFLVQLMKDTNPKFRFYKTQLAPNVTYLNMGGSEGKIIDIRCIYKVIKFINKVKPNIVHSHLNVLYSFIPSLVFFSIKFFHTVHNEAVKECLIVRGFSLKLLINFFYKNNFIRPVTISSASQQSFSSFYNNSKSYLVENGCSEKVKSDKFQEVANEIDSMKLDKDDLVFLNIGRCAVQKNHQMLVEVFNKLIREGKNAILIIIGEGFESELGQDVKKRAGNGIYFLGAKENVPDYFFLSDAFCLSSIYEGLPITLLESISTGCIPLCTPAGGVQEVIKSNIGLVSRDFSEEEYYNVIIKFIQERGSYKKRELKEYFIKNYSIKNTASKLMSIYSN